MPDRATLRKAAEERTKLHEGQESQRILCKDHDYISLVGENEFGEEFHLEVDLKPRPYGDSHIDFPTNLGIVDVKTSTHPEDLLVEVGKVKADIYVLVGYDRRTDKAWLIGWTWAREVRNAPTIVLRKDKNNKDIVNHHINHKDLLPIINLHQLGLKGIKRSEVYNNKDFGEEI